MHQCLGRGRGGWGGGAGAKRQGGHREGREWDGSVVGKWDGETGSGLDLFQGFLGVDLFLGNLTLFSPAVRPTIPVFSLQLRESVLQFH